jgi:hypothetical protein
MRPKITGLCEDSGRGGELQLLGEQPCTAAGRLVYSQGCGGIRKCPATGAPRCGDSRNRDFATLKQSLIIRLKARFAPA